MSTKRLILFTLIPPLLFLSLILFLKSCESQKQVTPVVCQKLSPEHIEYIEKLVALNDTINLANTDENSKLKEYVEKN